MLILIVEDDLAIAEALRRVGIQRGHQVRCVDTAKEALVAVAERRPDAMLLDIGLGGALDGRDVLSRLCDRSIPTIVHTGNADEFTAALCREYGALDVLQKPALPGAVIQKIEAAVAANA